MNDENNIKVFYAVNETHTNMCAVSMVSILKNTKKKVDFYIINYALSNESKQIINDVQKSEFIDFDINKFSDFKNIQLNTKIGTWYKIFIPDKFKNLDKAIFLHADTIFLDDINKLWEIDISEKMLAAVCDVWNAKSLIKKFNLKTDNYFNDGVMAINLKKWRETKFTEKIKKHLETNNHNIRETLNILIDEDKVSLSPTFNFMETWWYNYYVEYEGNMLEAYNNHKKHPCVVHFTYLKPFHPLNKNSFKKCWWEYASYIKSYINLLENYQLNIETNLDNYMEKIKSVK